MTQLAASPTPQPFRPQRVLPSREGELTANTKPDNVDCVPRIFQEEEGNFRAPSPALAVRAAFFARVHREKSLENWLKQIIQERLVDIEEAAFAGFKKDMIAKGSR